MTRLVLVLLTDTNVEVQVSKVLQAYLMGLCS